MSPETQGAFVLRVVCEQTLGGSSALNVMLVHRGAASDYESWVKAGADGWTPEEALKYFKSSEVHPRAPSPSGQRGWC